MNLNSENEQYVVVMNGEGQYSIWIVDHKVPLGWEKQEMMGSKQECLDYINEVWTDMRPNSVKSMFH